MTKLKTIAGSLDNSWFAASRFGMFIHWGSYSVLGHGEQSLFRELLTPSEYRKLADRFQAERFQPDDWAQVACQAGMQYLVLTTKHHDGFCLFQTDTTDYNAVQKGPGRDLVAEYVRACRKAGLRVGLYFSLADWSVPAHFAGPKKDPDGFRRFIRLVHRQVEELMTNYGRIDLLWFDGRNYFGAREWQSSRLVKMIRNLQPEIIINDRLPKPKQGGDWGYETPEQHVGGFSTKLWESCITSARHFWGYHVCHEDPDMWYSRRELLEFFVQTIANNGRLLLNVGPRSDGTLPEIFRDRMKFMGSWIQANRKAIFGASGANFEFSYGGCLTQKDNRLYLFFLYWPGREYSLPGFRQRLKSASFLADGKKITAVQEKHRIVFRNLPEKAPGICPVVELVFDAAPEPADWAAKRLWGINLEGLEDWAIL